MTPHFAVAVVISALCTGAAGTADTAQAPVDPQRYEREGTRKLVALVNDAAELVASQGEAAFAEFRRPNSRWREEETYIFVLDPDGKMLVHLDPAMEGKNQIDLKDPNGRPIIRGLLDAALAVPATPEGWYHYEWPAPGGLLPRWKSSYVRLVTAASVCTGGYEGFPVREQALLVLTDELTEARTIHREVWETYRPNLGDIEIVDLVNLVAQYVLFALINNAAQVAIEEGLAGIPAIDAVIASGGAVTFAPGWTVHRVEQSV